MVKRIFAEQALTARFIESDQAHDHLVRRRGPRECDGFLKDDAIRAGFNGTSGNRSCSTPRSLQMQRSTCRSSPTFVPGARSKCRLPRSPCTRRRRQEEVRIHEHAGLPRRHA